MMANTIKRGLFHALAALLFPLSSLFLPRTIFLAGTAALVAALLLIEFLRLNFVSVNRCFIFFFRAVMRERELAGLAASTYVAISALVAFLLFQKHVAVVAMCFLAIGDPLSDIVGTRFGKRKLFAKSMEGNLTCFVSCLLVGFALSYSVLDISLLLVIIGAFSAALIQALPLPVNDNLSIPLFSGLCMSLADILSNMGGL